MSILTLPTFVHNQTVNLYNHLNDQELQTKTNNENVVFPVVNEIFQFMESSNIAGEWFYNEPMLTEMKVVPFYSLRVIYCKNKTVSSESQSVYPDFSVWFSPIKISIWILGSICVILDEVYSIYYK